MPITIDQLVGEGAATAWRNTDVRQVAELLNNVEPRDGGPNPKLDVARGFTGPQLIEAIRKFQTHHFAGANGRIDVNYLTVSLLNQLVYGVPSGPVTSRYFALKYRSKTVEQAQTMVGMTSNAPVDEHGNAIDLHDPAQYEKKERRGWRYLKEFFDLAGIALPEWEFRKFVEGKGRTPNKIGWCSVFATWALVKAGHAMRYVPGRGIYPGTRKVPILYPLRYQSRDKRILATLGDVCVVNDKNTDYASEENPEGFLFHHIIIASEPDPAGKFDAIEGNFPHKQFVAQCVVDATTSYHGRRSLSEIMYYYDLYRPVSL